MFYLVSFSVFSQLDKKSSVDNLNMDNTTYFSHPRESITILNDSVLRYSRLWGCVTRDNRDFKYVKGNNIINIEYDLDTLKFKTDRFLNGAQIIYSKDSLDIKNSEKVFYKNCDFQNYNNLSSSDTSIILVYMNEQYEIKNDLDLEQILYKKLRIRKSKWDEFVISKIDNEKAFNRFGTKKPVYLIAKKEN